MTHPVLLVVAAAIFDPEGRVLLAQRPKGKSMAGLWEFPGGKLEDNESPETALARELMEELSIQVNTLDLKPLTFASHVYESFHLLMPLYSLKTWIGDVHPNEGQAFEWVDVSKIHDYPAPAADIPLFDFLAARNGTD